jgi:hypothetical protein
VTPSPSAFARLTIERTIGIPSSPAPMLLTNDRSILMRSTSNSLKWLKEE